MEMNIKTFFGTNSIALNDIDLFLSAGRGRGTNDANNKRREDILTFLHDLPEPYCSDSRWTTLSGKWRTFLTTLCAVPYDTVCVTKKGGRALNYDFDIVFKYEGSMVHSAKIEFKHNAASISSLPQYLSIAEKTPYLPSPYALFYYRHALDKIRAMYEDVPKPDIDTYMKCVYSNNYKKHELFQTLYEADCECSVPEERVRLVDESIATYLEENKHLLDMKLLTKDIRERQTGKVFVLWDLTTFRSDTIRDDEMEIVSVEGVKNGRVLVAVSKAGTRHNMLLRWKNHIGVLYPAWQISLSR